jgi:hypothetical protein
VAIGTKRRRNGFVTPFDSRQSDEGAYILMTFLITKKHTLVRLAAQLLVLLDGVAAN